MAYDTRRDDDLERELLLRELRGPANGNTGISGYGMPGGVEAPPLQTESPAVDYRNTRGGYLAGTPYANSEKLSRPWEDRSEKWQILSIMDHFDPAKGVTQEMVDALNRENTYGMKFGLTDKGDRLALLDRGTSRIKNTGVDDVIGNFTGTGTKTWNAWTDPEEQARRRAARQTGGGIGSGPSSFQTIQSLLPTDTNFYNSLQSQLVDILGGPRAFDREVLLRLLGAR